MPIKHFYFRFSLLGTILAIIGISVFSSLGIWQSYRALEKQQLQETMNRNASNEAFQLKAYIPEIDQKIYHKVNAAGHYDKYNEILIDNAIHSGKAGYHVLTPFILEDDQSVIMVNRGWVPVGRDRNILPSIETPQEAMTIHGIITPHKSKPPLILGEQDMTAKVWLYFDNEKYLERTKFTLLPVIILLDAKDKFGYVREWPKYDAKMSMHIGYAIQWFAFALFVIVTYFGVNIKKKMTP